MPKRILPLADKDVKNAAAKDKAYKLSDGEGLHLLVTPTGGKLWRLQYRYDGQQKQLAFGAYPAVSLTDARKKRATAKEQLENGIDPAAEKKAKKTIKNTINGADPDCFESVFREWHRKFKYSLWSEGHALTVLGRFENNVFPAIGKLLMKDIESADLLKVLRKVEERGALDQAKRIREHTSQVFQYAIATGRCKYDIAASLRKALPPVKNNHYPAPTDPVEVSRLVKAINEYKGSQVVFSALKMAMYTFLRPGELRGAKWAEIDLDKAIWYVPGQRMKMDDAHIVPLAKQAVEILKALQPVSGHSAYVFPSVRTPLKCISENTVNAALRSLGYTKEQMTGHGFRAMARTMLDEQLHVKPDWIEAQLAHSVPDRLGRSYNRTLHIQSRVGMMQQWADYLDGLAVTK